MKYWLNDWKIDWLIKYLLSLKVLILASSIVKIDIEIMFQLNDMCMIEWSQIYEGKKKHFLSVHLARILCSNRFWRRGSGPRCSSRARPQERQQEEYRSFDISCLTNISSLIRLKCPVLGIWSKRHVSALKYIFSPPKYCL